MNGNATGAGQRGADSLRDIVKAVGGGPETAEVILAWYACDQDVERLHRERPDLSRAVIDRVIAFYRPLRILVEAMLTVRLATRENPVNRRYMLQEWLTLSGLEDPEFGDAP